MKARNKYEMLFDSCYDLIKEALRVASESGSRMLDIGINNGNLELYLESEAIDCDVIGIDTDAAALGDLSSKDLILVNIEPVLADANDFLASFASPVDLVLLSATLHEINDPTDQNAYLHWFFGRVHELLPVGGKVVIGDYYFPETVTDAEFESFRAFQLQAINHADDRRKFVEPELLMNTASDCGFQVSSYNEIRAVTELDRRYYAITLEKS